MNRRSLLLGGVVASVAGILGVKARPVEVAATPTSTEIRTPWVDGRDTAVKVEKPVTIQWEPIEEIYPALSGYQADFEVDRSWLLDKLEQEQLVNETSGYQVNQLMPHGTPPMRPRPYPFVIDPGDDITFSGVPVPNYWYSINPDLSDLRAAIPNDTDS